ncbi:hypothetical protein [Methanospirillum lacunae]
MIPVIFKKVYSIAWYLFLILFRDELAYTLTSAIQPYWYRKTIE